MSKRELAVWGLPIPMRPRDTAGPVLQALLRGEGRSAEQLPDITQGLPNRSNVANAVQNRLWLNELLADLQHPVHQEILQILWDSILEAIADGCDDVQANVVQENIKALPIMQRIKHFLFGKNVVQFSQIWSAALRAALPAARNAGHGQYRPDRTHEGMFDIDFRAGTAEALRAAQEVVRTTSSKMADAKRDSMWELVWDVWDEVWEHSLAATRTMIAGVVENTLKEIAGWVVEDVVKKLGDSKEQKVQATIQFKPSPMLHIVITLGTNHHAEESKATVTRTRGRVVT
ncbi:hypothetical protein RhiJN_07843 [Ceratobasidium sp. AG-Ba]|nr:hypothetical protein RhiJN_07843 [Ceratobasidium sp. AG-Ba]QRW08658.1 hypothetical protein RhiLY_07657 [Ceratobasidium sp. AG-Ba]